MNWTHVILAGYIGAVIAVVVGFARKKGWIGKVAALVIAAVAIVAWNIIDVKYLIPRDGKASMQAQVSQMDEAFNKMPVYQVMKEHQPALFESVRQRSLTMHKEGKTEQEIIDAIQPQILAFQMKQLQNAADANVVAYMQINMQQTAMVQKASDDECFRFLFPAVKGGINAVRIIPREVTMRRMEVDADMLRSAFGPDKHTVTAEEREQAQRDIQPIVQQLVKQYGQDIQLMEDPRQAIGKEAVACNLVQDLWRNVMLLPPQKAAAIIRLSVEGQ
ncbi:topoisomerase II [Enterobacteriaceae bacterium H18W14]|uniref:topoisomerase II n=1 Tax=Dryocola boscaweniae TaxID=2925397 RepID=UPI0022EFDB75|nr:topoisomerase II [Dryocola boscaweniae]MCT4715060.1 topoisomerase II [Dryocola boscaweniae]